MCSRGKRRIPISDARSIVQWPILMDSVEWICPKELAFIITTSIYVDHLENT